MKFKLFLLLSLSAILASININAQTKTQVGFDFVKSLVPRRVYDISKGVDKDGMPIHFIERSSLIVLDYKKAYSDCGKLKVAFVLDQDDNGDLGKTLVVIYDKAKLYRTKDDEGAIFECRDGFGDLILIATENTKRPETNIAWFTNLGEFITTAHMQ